MSKLYESILKKFDEMQELLDISRKNILYVRDFIDREMIHEPELVIKKLYSDVYRKIQKGLPSISKLS